MRRVRVGAFWVEGIREGWMAWGAEHDAVRAVVVDYLEGMCWGDEVKLRRAFHPDA
jgi:hypothetical protein